MHHKPKLHTVLPSPAQSHDSTLRFCSSRASSSSSPTPLSPHSKPHLFTPFRNTVSSVTPYINSPPPGNLRFCWMLTSVSLSWWWKTNHLKVSRWKWSPIFHSGWKIGWSSGLDHHAYSSWGSLISWSLEGPSWHHQAVWRLAGWRCSILVLPCGLAASFRLARACLHGGHSTSTTAREQTSVHKWFSSLSLCHIGKMPLSRMNLKVNEITEWWINET